MNFNLAKIIYQKQKSFQSYSKDGFLFDKEAILQYIITKKTEYARKLKEYERQKAIEDSEAATETALEEQKKLQKFISAEKNIVTTRFGEFKVFGGSKHLNRFW